jgi:hypothetical protein
MTANLHMIDQVLFDDPMVFLTLPAGIKIHVFAWIFIPTFNGVGD